MAKPAREGALFNALLDALGSGHRPAAPAGSKKQRFFQRVAQLQLAKLGYTPDIVAGGAEALKALEEHTYDLVFMDCQLPDMDGFETTIELRRREGGERHTPVVAAQ